MGSVGEGVAVCPPYVRQARKPEYNRAAEKLACLLAHKTNLLSPSLYRGHPRGAKEEWTEGRGASGSSLGTATYVRKVAL